MPELGQIIHGNPMGNYHTRAYQDALILHLLDEAERVYWNNKQEEWERWQDPEIPGMEFRPYYWGDEETEAAKPNLKFDFSKQEVRWYKHPGRSMTVTIDWKPEKWVEWFNKGLEVIRKADTI